MWRDGEHEPEEEQEEWTMPGEKRILLMHVDESSTGCSRFINEIFLPEVQDRVDTSASKMERVRNEFNFRRRNCKLEVDGLWVQPGNYIQLMLKVYGEQIGKIKTSTTTIRQLHPKGRQIRSVG